MSSPASPAAARAGAASRAALIVAGVAASAALRVSLGGPEVAASLPAAAAFTAGLCAVALAAGGWRIGLHPRDAVIGAAGAALLVLAWWIGRAHGPLGLAPASSALVAWSPVVIGVAIAEEAVLRGVLFAALLERGGVIAAITVSAAVFALLHVPLYGWGALPLDVAAGLWLGGLRLAGGSWAAPAVAHVLADLAGGWLT